MKLNRLDLKAFGPFTGCSLLFNSREPGLHIIFGPNEAGKSSALRALKALFYGFPQQTADNFRHSYDQLLVGGCLENSNGDQIYFQRRKKRISSIIDAEGNPLDAKMLLPFLHGMEPEIFESLYGIDHDSLIRGGEDILAQKGEVGKALFAAGAGLTSLREVIELLEKEASELFKSAGQLPRINKSIKRFKELKKEARSANLSIKEWKEHQNSLKQGLVERTSLEDERNRKHKELRHLQRMEQAIPELASLKAWQAQLDALGEVTLLPPDFAKRHQKVSLQMSDARSQLQKDSDRLEQTRKKRETISFNKELLNRADTVDDFHQRLGEYRKGQKDRPERNGMRISLRREAALALKQVRPDLELEHVEILRPVLTKKRTIQRLSTEYEVIYQRLKQAGEKCRTAEQELEEAGEPAALEDIVDFQELHRAVKLAQKAGDIDSYLSEGQDEINQGKKNCFADLRRLGFNSVDLAAFMKLPLPLAETVQRFEKEYSDFTEERREQETDRKKGEEELKQAAAEIKKIEYAGEIPSEEDLTLSREKRDQGWKLLRRQWLEEKDVTEETAAYDPDRLLPDAYENHVAVADLIGDRLRREAERVANRATLRARAETAEETLTDNKTRQEILKQQKLDLDLAWSDIWEPLGVVPLSPKEMNGWLTEVDKLRYRAGEIIKKEHAIDRDARRRLELRAGLSQQLETLGERIKPVDDTLGSILVSAEGVLEQMVNRSLSLEKRKEQQKKTLQAFNQSQADLKTNQEALAEWKKQWNTALADLGLTREVSVHETLDLVEILQNCFDKIREADDIKKRIDGIDRDAAELTNDVRAMLKEMAPDKLALPIDHAILHLGSMLNQTRKDSTIYENLSEELSALQVEVSSARKNVLSVNEQMSELLKIARCTKPEEVATVIAQFAEHQRLQEKVSDAYANLARIGLGEPVEELARQAEKIAIDDLPLQFEVLQREIDERINPEINAVSQVIGEHTARLAAMDGNAGGAEIAEKMEQELARIRRLTERYVQVKLASKILQQEIERYREEHQDPVLKIGSRYFTELTMGSLKGLKTDVDDKGDPILVGIRPDNTWIGVDGMSDGTRDQLYLALRLATLESRLENSEPMPFIVDDILINFDDDRSRATLKALAELGTKNQVILFTHHRQIMEEAKNLQNGKKIHLHEI